MVVYLVSEEIQPREVDRCFQSCGKIIIGMIEYDGFWWIPCKHKDCPYEEKTMLIEGADIDNDKASIRKLIASPKGGGDG